MTTGHKIVSNEKVYNDTLTLFGQAFQRNVRNGCGVTPGTGLQVAVAEGQVNFGSNVIPVSPQNINLVPNDTSDDRYDLIAFNSSGECTSIIGVASSSPVPPLMNWDNYGLLARVLVEDAATEIPEDDIKDMRIISTAAGGAGGGAGGLGRYATNFSSVTSLVVTHNLGDISPDVIVYDETYQMFLPEEIKAIDLNTIELTFSTSVAGVVSVFGGSFSGTAKYLSSFTNTSIINVTHNLEEKYVITKVYDGNDEEIEPEKVELIDTTTLQVTLGSATSGVVVVSGGSLNTAVFGVKKYTEEISGDTTYIINHNLNTETPLVQVYDENGVITSPVSITTLNATAVEIELGDTNTATVEVHGGLQSVSPGAGEADFLPDTDKEYDIGSGTFKWKDIYADNVNVKNVLSRKGTTMTTGRTLAINSATQIMAENANRLTSTIYNNSLTTSSIYLGTSGVSILSGFPLGQAEAFIYEDADAIYAVSESTSGIDVRHIEVQ